MKALIDNREVEHSYGYEYGKDINGRRCKVAYHGQDVLEHHCSSGKENVKLVSQGHLYVLNYNKKTFVPSYPMTFEEYRGNGNKL